ncbi:MAG: amidophosphoribosyltransferase [Planctomycetes bacterium]|nr:amidophosphoribosyltransferase [Planctomycetota bacterium]MDA0947471.1 amidophosphoribosyltransferase [Planctomycetota bacterium]
MCGFIGIFGPDGVDVAPEIYEGLLAVQHRGQDAAGMITYTDRFNLRKSHGLVSEVFTEEHMVQLRGHVGVGHVRYPTVGENRSEDAQPFHHTFPIGTAMVHNGNVTNFAELHDSMFAKGTRLNSTCDLEVLLYVFQQALAERYQAKGGSLDEEDVFHAVGCVYEKVKGAYSVCAFIADLGMVAFRDPYGIKPICFGEKTDERGRWFACASESVVLDVNGYRRTLDIGPGEAVFISHDRTLTHRKVGPQRHTPCIFEYVYFSRPDSFLDDVSVYKTRRRFGKALGKQWKAGGAPTPDVVIPIPDSSRDAAMAMASELKIRYREGLVKNRYIGRTFIMPNHQSRSTSIRRKLNALPLEFKGKDVLLVDDSIVRGNTSRRIVQMARDAGARRVYFAVTSPPLVAPCPYGVDMASKTEFVADGRTVDEIASFLGVDHLVYLDREAMNIAAAKGNPRLESFCNACFTGEYPTPDVTLERLKAIEDERGARRSNPAVC